MPSRSGFGATTPISTLGPLRRSPTSPSPPAPPSSPPFAPARSWARPRCASSWRCKLRTGPSWSLAILPCLMPGSVSRGIVGGSTMPWPRGPLRASRLCAILPGTGVRGRALSRHHAAQPLLKIFFPLLPAQRLRRLAHADQLGGGAADHRVGRDVLGHHCVGADDRVVADRDAAQDAGSVAHPDVRADVDVALVD